MTQDASILLRPGQTSRVSLEVPSMTIDGRQVTKARRFLCVVTMGVGDLELSLYRVKGRKQTRDIPLARLVVPCEPKG